ncbi:hypothetical protein [uncultured Erythrobacter sp.]|uniref:hypothetical protein n=1 Tax=uncultured Erythrobacter sp. TaxID=263913 RepID=UPI002634EAA0|nr:hypothetical protein [uncultured Erythrobacter sp.]
MKFNRRKSLPDRVRYRILDEGEGPTFNARLGWIVSSRRDARRGEPVYIGIKVFHDDTSSSNWEAVSDCYQTVHFTGEPLEVLYLGNVIHILGFTEDGDLRFRIEPASDPQEVGFVYQRKATGPYDNIFFRGHVSGLDVCN